MKILMNDYTPKQINKNDIVVDCYYDRHQKLYAICLKDINTGDYISDYEYAIDKKEAQFIKGLMEKDPKNWLYDSYELLESLNEDNNYGYHAGDLGKSEQRERQTGGRGTGHFGTGTYFVGNPDKIKGYNDYQYGKGEAPHHIVDFSSYNLYKPSNNFYGYKLHDTLKELNNGYKYYSKYGNDYEWFMSKNLTASDSGNFEVRDIPEIVSHLNNLLSYNLIELPKDIDWNTIEDEYEKEDDRIYDELKDKYKDENGHTNYSKLFDAVEDELDKNPKFKEKNEIVGEIRRGIESELRSSDLDNYKRFKKLQDRLNDALEHRHSKEEITNALNEVNKHLDDKTGDSLSTIFMKALGYDGVDVRHLNKDSDGWAGLDNTTYGSVIYDVKPETIVEDMLVEMPKFANLKKLPNNEWLYKEKVKIGYNSVGKYYFVIEPDNLNWMYSSTLNDLLKSIKRELNEHLGSNVKLNEKAKKYKYFALSDYDSSYYKTKAEALKDLVNFGKDVEVRLYTLKNVDDIDELTSEDELGHYINGKLIKEGLTEDLKEITYDKDESGRDIFYNYSFDGNKVIVSPYRINPKGDYSHRTWDTDQRLKPNQQKEYLDYLIKWDEDKLNTLIKKREKEYDEPISKLKQEIENAKRVRDSYSKINESLDTFTFPNLRQAIDYYWKDRNANVEKVSIQQLVDDNNLLDDDDLQSYHQRQWDNKKAKEFSIDKGKVNSMRLSEVPYAVRHKDGKLELGDGRHRTRALYNDGYKFVEIPVLTEQKGFNHKNDTTTINEEKTQNSGNFNIQNVFHGGPHTTLHPNFKSTLWFSEDFDYALDFGENIFICNLSIKNMLDIGNTDGYIRGLIPTQFNLDFTNLAHKLNLEPKDLLKIDRDAKNIYTIVRTKEFKDLCVKNGYDGIKTIEEGNVCYGVFDISQVEIVDTDFEEELTEALSVPTDKFKGLINDCVYTLEKNGFKLPLRNDKHNLKFKLMDSGSNLGFAYYPKSSHNGDFLITLSKYLENMEDEQIKSVIYHELGHILTYMDELNNGYIYIDENGDTKLSGDTNSERKANRKKLSHHGPKWQSIMKQISDITGQSYQRLASAEDSQAFKDATKEKYLYNFKCPNCGTTFGYMKKTDFVKNYNKLDKDGNPYWWCRDCRIKTGKKIPFVKTEDSK